MMKNRIKFLLLAGYAIVMFSCKSNTDIPEPEPEIEKPAITFITKGNAMTPFIVSGIEPFTVDWGDGGGKGDMGEKYTREEGTYTSFNPFYRVTISQITQPTRTVSIYGQIVGFSLNGNAFLVSKLDVSNAPLLKTLNFDNSSITSLDLKKNLALKTVYLQKCQLSTDSLNKLFESLPNRPDANGWGEIYIENNPGTRDCNVQIAFDKKWAIRPDNRPPPAPYSFSDSELEQIGRCIALLPDSIKVTFEEKFLRWKETWYQPPLMFSSDPYAFGQSEEYFDFLNYCKKYDKAIWPLLFDKLPPRIYSLIINIIKDLIAGGDPYFLSYLTYPSGNGFIPYERTCSLIYYCQLLLEKEYDNILQAINDQFHS